MLVPRGRMDRKLLRKTVPRVDKRLDAASVFGCMSDGDAQATTKDMRYEIDMSKHVE